jgi:hypothetical protein
MRPQPKTVRFHEDQGFLKVGKKGRKEVTFLSYAFV